MGTRVRCVRGVERVVGNRQRGRGGGFQGERDKERESGVPNSPGSLSQNCDRHDTRNTYCNTRQDAEMCKYFLSHYFYFCVLVCIQCCYYYCLFCVEGRNQV